MKSMSVGFRPHEELRYARKTPRHRLGRKRTEPHQDSLRPRFFGRRCGSGFVDQRLENRLREALIYKNLIGLDESDHPVLRSRWRHRTFWLNSSIWFERDKILRLWPAHNEMAGIAAAETSPVATESTDPGAVLRQRRNSEVLTGGRKK